LDKLQSLFLHMQYKMRQGQALDIAIKRSEWKSRLQTLTEDSYEKTKAFFNFPFTIYTELQQLDEQQKAEIEQTVNSFWILCQLGDDIIEIENGVKQEKLSLTFPLAYLLDNWEELETNEQNFLWSIIGQQRALTLEEAEGLTKIYRKYQTAITQSTKDIFNKNQIFLQNWPLPKEVQQAMLGISRQVCKPTFRDHSSSLL
jgi:geranylgeranyl pyrophosphate synthase